MGWRRTLSRCHSVGRGGGDLSPRRGIPCYEREAAPPTFYVHCPLGHGRARNKTSPTSCSTGQLHWPPTPSRPGALSTDFENWTESESCDLGRKVATIACLDFAGEASTKLFRLAIMPKDTTPCSSP